MKIKDLPKVDRPREKLIAKGAENLKDSELLAILLGTGTKGKNVLEVAQDILSNYPKKKLLGLNFAQFKKINGIGPAKATQILAALEFANRVLEVDSSNTLPIVQTTKDIIAQISFLREHKKENFVGLGGNLKYFKTDFVDYKESTDRNKIKLTKEAVEMLCVKEGTFESVLDNEDFKIFKNHDHYTGIIFNQLAIEDFKKAIKDIKVKINVYIFSLGDDSFEDEFEDIKQKVKLSPIPEAILSVYRKIFK